MLYLKILFITLVIGSSGLYAQRTSILDDPNFLEGINSINNSDSHGEPPCNCSLDNQVETNFLRARARGLRCTSSRSLPGSNGAGLITSINCARAGDESPGGVQVITNSSYPFFSRAPGVSSTMNRVFRFSSEDGSMQGTFLEVEDNILPQDSYNVKSRITLLPRRQIPSATVVGDEVRIVLTTGEVVIFDAQTNKIKSGALNDGPVDTNTNRHARQPPSVNYTGSGISIRTDHRYEVPSGSAGDQTAEVRQGSRVCQVPRARLYDNEGRPIANDDAGMVRTINQVCPAGSGQRPFSI